MTRWQDRLNDPGHVDFVGALSRLLFPYDWEKASELAELIDDRIRQIIMTEKEKKP